MSPISSLVQEIVGNQDLPIVKTDDIGHGPDSKCVIIGELLTLGREEGMEMKDKQKQSHCGTCEYNVNNYCTSHNDYCFMEKPFLMKRLSVRIG